MSDHIKIVLETHVKIITLSRPDKSNAITAAMYSAMSAALEDADANPDVRVVIIKGEGANFTAGNDLTDFLAQSSDPSLPELEAFRFVRNLGRFRKPLIAAVQGNAIGVGFTLLLHCDLVYLADDAKLAAPFTNLALVPEAASSWLLPLRLGHVRSYAMFALGERIDAQTALEFGLANAVLPAEEVQAKALAAAATLAQKSVASLLQTKLLMRDRTKIASRIEEEREYFLERMQSREALEAFTAFTRRRPS